MINNWTRNIGLLAATFLTLDDLAPNRVICGIGAWWDPLASNVGIKRRKQLTAMRETVDVMRRLLNMERVTFHGEFHNVEGIELDVVHGRREPRNIPIMIGATGDQMMELTGEIADGVVLNYCVPPEYNDTALELLTKGLEKSGRKLEDFDRPQLIVCSVDEDHDTAIDHTKGLLCQYLAQQPHIAKASGVSQEVIQEIQSILGWPATKEQINKAKHLVPDDLVHRITASGTPEEAIAQGERIPEARLHLPDPVSGGRQLQVIDRYVCAELIVIVVASGDVARSNLLALTKQEIASSGKESRAPSSQQT